MFRHVTVVNGLGIFTHLHNNDNDVQDEVTQ